MVVVDASTHVYARLPDGDMRSPKHPTDMSELIPFVTSVLELGGMMMIGNTTDRFRPVSTWHGDLVCGYHLYHLVELECSGRRGL